MRGARRKGPVRRGRSKGWRGSGPIVLYLEALRRRHGVRDANTISDLHWIIEAILGVDTKTPSSPRRNMLHTFTSVLLGPLRYAAGELASMGYRGHVSIDDLMDEIRRGLAKTQREADREFRSKLAKDAWARRRGQATVREGRAEGASA